MQGTTGSPGTWGLKPALWMFWMQGAPSPTGGLGASGEKTASGAQPWMGLSLLIPVFPIRTLQLPLPPNSAGMKEGDYLPSGRGDTAHLADVTSPCRLLLSGRGHEDDREGW